MVLRMLYRYFRGNPSSRQTGGDYNKCYLHIFLYFGTTSVGQCGEKATRFYLWSVEKNTFVNATKLKGRRRFSHERQSHRVLELTVQRGISIHFHIFLYPTHAESSICISSLYHYNCTFEYSTCSYVSTITFIHFNFGLPLFSDFIYFSTRYFSIFKPLFLIIFT